MKVIHIFTNSTKIYRSVFKNLPNSVKVIILKKSINVIESLNPIHPGSLMMKAKPKNNGHGSAKGGLWGNKSSCSFGETPGSLHEKVLSKQIVFKETVVYSSHGGWQGLQKES